LGECHYFYCHHADCRGASFLSDYLSFILRANVKKISL
jgi:hypothetical protein